MNICILGSNGLLGSRLSPYLSSHGHKIIKIGKEENDIKHKLNNMTVDVVINLAALTNVDLCEENPKLAFQCNVIPIMKIAKYIKKNSFLIHISTDQIYSGKGPHNEKDVIKPCNIYGTSKYEGELIAKELNSVILRTNYVAKSVHDQKKSFTDWFVDSLRNKKNITLYKDIIFNPIHGDYLCEIILTFAKSKIKGTFNLGSTESISKANFFIKIAQKLNLDLKTAKLGLSTDNFSKTIRPSDMSLEIKKIQNLGIKMPSIKETIDEVVKEYIKG